MAIIEAIPPSFNEGFKDLGLLSTEDFETIVKALNKAPLFSSLDKLADFVLEFEDNYPVICETIFESIGSLYAIVDNNEVKDEVSKDIANISEELNQLGTISKEEYEERVRYLLNNKAIYYAYKAEDLFINYDNVFINTKIVSDIRPVFELDVENQPNAGMILHNLSIHYQSNEEPYHKDITIVLNSNHIKTLQEALSRAQKKEIGLKALFEKTGISNLL